MSKNYIKCTNCINKNSEFSEECVECVPQNNYKNFEKIEDLLKKKQDKKLPVTSGFSITECGGEPLLTIASGTSIIDGTTTGSAAIFGGWNDPKLLDVKEVGESLELIYKQTSNVTLTTFGTYIDKSERVYKIVYSCIDGKWNKSEKIFGQIIPKSEEHYIF